MIGFIKWLICQYQIYKMEKTFKRNDDNPALFVALNEPHEYFEINGVKIRIRKLCKSIF